MSVCGIIVYCLSTFNHFSTTDQYYLYEEMMCSLFIKAHDSVGWGAWLGHLTSLNPSLSLYLKQLDQMAAKLFPERRPYAPAALAFLLCGLPRAPWPRSSSLCFSSASDSLWSSRPFCGKPACPSLGSCTLLAHCKKRSPPYNPKRNNKCTVLPSAYVLSLNSSLLHENKKKNLHTRTQSESDFIPATNDDNNSQGFFVVV